MGKTLTALALLGGFALPGIAAEATRNTASPETHARWSLIERYCYECHNTTDWAGGAAFDTMSFDTLARRCQGLGIRRAQAARRLHAAAGRKGAPRPGVRRRA